MDDGKITNQNPPIDYLKEVEGFLKTMTPEQILKMKGSLEESLSLLSAEEIREALSGVSGSTNLKDLAKEWLKSGDFGVTEESPC